MYQKITISGLICTGKSSLFHNLQNHLQWPSFSVSQFFRNYSKEIGVSLEKAEEQKEQVILSVDSKVQLMLQTPGHLLVEGWMVGLMADDFPGILKILLTSEEQKRVDRFAKREHISMKEAAQRILERESNLFRRLETIYHRHDFVDPKRYTFVLDTTKLTPDEVIAEVIKLL